MNETPATKLVYEPLPVCSTKSEVESVIARNNVDELKCLPFAIGESFPDWKFAQDVCLKLAGHSDLEISSNACMGLGYIARNHGKLEKHLVKPVILRELKRHVELKGCIEDAISDINRYMKWNLASKALSHSKNTL